MGTKYAIRLIRNPEEETMKRLNTIDKLILLGFSVSNMGTGHAQPTRILTL